MAAHIEVLHMGRHDYAVAVPLPTGGATQHRVVVPPHLLASLGLAEGDEERLIRETFAFLLEHEPQEAILREFSLDVVEQYFPEYDAEIRRRLGRG